MNKLERQQAAWKYQEAINEQAERERLARLATHVDLELQRLNQANEARAKQSVDNYKAIKEWEQAKDGARDLWELELLLRSKATDKAIVDKLEEYHQTISAKACRQRLSLEDWCE